MKFLLLLLLLAPATLAQNDLPTISTLAEIHGKTKYYVIADTDDREKIVQVLKKRSDLTAVGSPDDAEFFIEYHQAQPNASMNFVKGQMDVFVRRDQKKVIAWSEATTGRVFKSVVAGELADKFVRTLKKT